MNARKINTIAQTWRNVWTHRAAMNVTASKDTRGMALFAKVKKNHIIMSYWQNCCADLKTVLSYLASYCRY